MDCEVEEALYGQVHYASSLLVSEKTVSGEISLQHFFREGINELNSWCEFIIGVKNTLEKTVDNGDSVIKILSSDEEEDDGTTVVTGVSSNSVAYPGGYIDFKADWLFLLFCCA